MDRFRGVQATKDRPGISAHGRQVNLPSQMPERRVSQERSEGADSRPGRAEESKLAGAHPEHKPGHRELQHRRPTGHRHRDHRGIELRAGPEGFGEGEQSARRGHGAKGRNSQSAQLALASDLAPLPIPHHQDASESSSQGCHQDMSIHSEVHTPAAQLSDPACGRRGWQLERGGRDRCGAWLEVIGLPQSMLWRRKWPPLVPRLDAYQHMNSQFWKCGVANHATPSVPRSRGRPEPQLQ